MAAKKQNGTSDNTEAEQCKRGIAKTKRTCTIHCGEK